MQSTLLAIWEDSTGMHDGYCREDYNIGDIARRMIDALCDEYGVSESTADRIVERFISDL